MRVAESVQQRHQAREAEVRSRSLASHDARCMMHDATWGREGGFRDSTELISIQVFSPVMWCFVCKWYIPATGPVPMWTPMLSN